MGKMLRDSEKYAVLAAAYASDDMREGTKIDHSDVGGYRTKTVRAGEYLYISCYPLIGCNANRTQRRMLEEDLAADRKQKAKIRMRYAKYNNKRRIQEMEQLVHANFVKGDMHISCTYEKQDYEQMSQLEYRTREEARKDIRNFIRRVKGLLKKHNCDLNQFRWICVTVTKESDKEAPNPLPDSHHHHMLVHGIPQELRNDVENLWKKGYCNADRLRDSENGFADIAGYIARQEGSYNGERPGERSYSTSKNIIRPKVTTSDNKLSRRRASMIAADVRIAGNEIFEKLFDGYRLVERARVDVSTFVAGAYIYAKMRRKQQRR